MVEKHEIGVVVVGYKDRLTGFGFRYLERYFSSHGVRIEVVNGEEPKDAYQELVEDLIALVSSFAGKLYGLRSHKYERVVEAKNTSKTCPIYGEISKPNGHVYKCRTCGFQADRHLMAAWNIAAKLLMCRPSPLAAKALHEPLIIEVRGKG